jgi:hypothetical protein
MKITIDSSESLDQVLHVVGAMFGVPLQVGAPDGEVAPAPTPAATSTTARRGRGGTARAGRAATRRSRRRPEAEGGSVREWARSQGYEISDRGPIPAAVRTAYQAAQTS